MDPFSGLVVVAGVAGVTKALSANAERIISAIEDKFHRSVEPQARIVIVTREASDSSVSDRAPVSN